MVRVVKSKTQNETKRVVTHKILETSGIFLYKTNAKTELIIKNRKLMASGIKICSFTPSLA